MTKLQFDYLSSHLETAHRRMLENRHGGMVLTGEDLEETIQNFGEFVRMAKYMESELSRREWNHRAQDDLRRLVNEPSAIVLDAMRNPDSNVVGFPGRSRGQGGPSGGDGA
ncbi:hypothetical protein [Rhizobium arsenicireducens]